LRESVEGAWLALGGPACVEQVTDLEDAEIYLQYLEDAEEAGGIADLAAFEEGLAKLYALPDLEARDTDPQILTIHKAKGLEFDTVIVPSLGRRTRPPEAKLFLWTRRLSADGDGSAELLLAPIKQTGADADPIYDYLARLDRERERYEQGRLLYVASTRAKKHLHLLGHVKPDVREGAIEGKAPAKDSLLETLWPALESEFQRAAASLSPEKLLNAPSSPAEEVARMPDQNLRRLPADWSLPTLPPAVNWTPLQEEDRVGEEIEFSWVGETARHVGSVVHRWLQRIAEDEMKGWDRARLEQMRKVFRDELGMRGIPEAEIDEATTRIIFALGNSLEDARGRWLLGPQQQAQNEFRITALIDGERRNFVIDRTFIDQEGKRRIVDYKTGSREGADIEGFLDQERERYRQQLEHYALALGANESDLGLYFPLLSGWREWKKQR
jgi:ATP-dependent exoDNAse (exonuclease V) beta subunit